MKSLLTAALAAVLMGAEQGAEIIKRPSTYKIPLTKKQKKARSKNKDARKARKTNRK